MGQVIEMNHSEALEQMATERYLLNELSPELRDAFEDHLFDCPECALDLRAAQAFVTEAKAQLPELTASPANPQRAESLRPGAKPNRETNSVFAWLRPFFANPAFAAPLFATLLVILGYQNFVTYPALRAEVSTPTILPWTSLHAGTRAAAHVAVKADRKQGVMLLLDLPQQPDYLSYSFQLNDTLNQQTHSIWTQTLSASQASNHDGTLSLLIPGAELRQGAYTLTVFGITASGDRTQIEQHILDLQIEDLQNRLPAQ